MDSILSIISNVCITNIGPPPIFGPTQVKRRKVSNAYFVVLQNSDENFEVFKDRYKASVGKVSLQELLIMIIRRAGGNSLSGIKVFDEPIKRDLINAINDVLSKYSIERGKENDNI